MIRFRDISIRHKLSIIMVLTSCVALVLACGVFVTHDYLLSRERMIEQMSSLANVIAVNSQASLAFDDPDAGVETLNALSAYPNIDGGCLYRRDGALFAENLGANSVGVEHAIAARTAIEYGAISRIRGEHVEVFSPIEFDGDTVGVVFIQGDISTLNQLFSRYAGIAGLVLVASLCVAFLLATLLQRVISKPILELADTAREVSQRSDYSVRFERDSRDEIGALISAFNRMISQVQQRDKELQVQLVRLKKQNDQLEQAKAQVASLTRGARCLLWHAKVTQFGADFDWNMSVWDEEGAQAFLPVRIPAGSRYSKVFHNCVFPDDLVRMGEVSSRALRTHQPGYSNEFRCRRADGEVRWLIEDVRVEPIEEGMWSLIGVCTDITERKTTEDALQDSEAQLRQAQKMEAVGRLAGGVAHDFNNLLTAISGFSEMMLDTLSRDDPNFEFVSEIKDAAQRASGLTSQLLAFGRRQIVQPKIVDVNGIMTGMHKMLERLIGEDVELITRTADDLDSVKMDPGQLEQLIMNLVVNARDAMPAGGQTIIETCNCELDETHALRHEGVAPGRYVMLTVSDTGVGIPPEVKDKIFEPFFTTKAVDKGTGLGLSTVYGIVEQSGGYIWVYSEVNKGTMFKVYFPAVPRDESEDDHDVELRADCQGTETILLVEDEQWVRSLLQRSLTKNGYTVIEAESGNEALDKSRRHAEQIDMMITDVVMPGLSGIELAEIMGKHRPEMKVMYMSGYAEHPHLERVIVEEGNFIQKPFSLKNVVQEIRNVFDNSHA